MSYEQDKRLQEKKKKRVKHRLVPNDSITNYSTMDIKLHATALSNSLMQLDFTNSKMFNREYDSTLKIYSISS